MRATESIPRQVVVTLRERGHVHRRWCSTSLSYENDRMHEYNVQNANAKFDRRESLEYWLGVEEPSCALSRVYHHVPL